MTAKYAPAAIITLAGAVPFDLMFIPLILAAMIAAWLAKAAKLYASEATWREIRRDLIISIMIGGANAILIALLIVKFNLDPLEGMGVAFFLALGGVETIDIAWSSAKRIWNWLMDKWFESESTRRQNDAKLNAAEEILRTRELETLAKKLDEGKTDEPQTDI